MIRLLVLCLSLLGLSILLASAVITFLASNEDAEIQYGGNEATEQSTTGTVTDSNTAPKPFRPSILVEKSQLVDEQPELSRLSTTVSAAISSQVSTRLGEFLDNLEGDDRRRENVKNALTQAYAQAAASSTNSDSAAGFLSDSNFIVNTLESILDDDELTQLETHLETVSRDEFLQTYSPQLELISPELDASSKQFLLESLFTETYAATNPNGNTSGQTSDFIAAQLEAIRLTRDSIRGALSGAQLELANKFLSEQEAGLKTAKEIFGSPPQ